MTSTPILVLAANGKTGSRVAARLAAAGQPVRRGSRAGDPPFDWSDRDTWDAALDGVGAVYVAYLPELAFPGAADDVGALAEHAARAGVRRLVMLSGRGEDGALAAEQALQAAGVEWTVVRSSAFAQNFDEGLFLDAVLAGEIAVPAGDVGEPFIDVDDIADVAVAALTEPGHAGEVYEVTGPRLLTFGQAAAEIAAASGRDVRYVPLTAAEFEAMLVGLGLPAGEATGLTELFAAIFDGRNAHTADGVERALGRPARDFREYARRAASSGVWATRMAS
jgi:uncharacterized protein YbjT (DUF2867 family)